MNQTELQNKIGALATREREALDRKDDVAWKAARAKRNELEAQILPECSMCRARHGAEIGHACE